MYINKEELIKIIWPIKNNKNIYRHGICNYTDDFGVHFEIIFKYNKKPYRIIYTLKSCISELYKIGFFIKNITKKDLIKYLNNHIRNNAPKDMYIITPVILIKTIKLEWKDMDDYEADIKFHKKYTSFGNGFFEKANGYLQGKKEIMTPESIER